MSDEAHFHLSNYINTPQLAQYEVNRETFFQQDEANSHKVRVSMNIVNVYFQIMWSLKMGISHGLHTPFKRHHIVKLILVEFPNEYSVSG